MASQVGQDTGAASGEASSIPGVDRPTLIGTLVFLAIGLGLLTGAGFAARSARAFRDWRVVEGTVQGTSEGPDRHGEWVCRTTVEWTGTNGQKHLYDTYPGCSEHVERGAKLPLRVDPSDPDTVTTGSPEVRWISPAILGVMGVVFTGIATRVAARAARKRIA